MKKLFVEKRIPRKSLSFLLSVCIMISMLSPLIGLIVFKAAATETYINYTLDDSTGLASNKWFDPLDNRYTTEYPSGYTLGASATPYIIKSGDELAGLSVLVNSGTSFVNNYIDIQGLTNADLETYSSNCEVATIDLRPYEGYSKSVLEVFIWTAIGTSDHPFGGHIYSTTNAKIINFTYNYNYNSNYTINNNCYGLFGYNQGTIGLKPDGVTDGGFSVVATEVATAEGAPKQLNLNTTTIKTFGGVVAVNSGTVNAITFTGIVNLPAIVAAVGAPCKFGGVVGDNIGTVSKCSFTDDTVTSSFIGWTQNSSDPAFVRTFGGTSTYAFVLGGVVGSTSGAVTISGCSSYADIELPRTDTTTKTPSVAGGVVGSCASSTITNCNYYGDIKSLGEVTATTQDLANGIGGIVGYSTGAVSYCISNSNINFDSTASYQVGDYIKVGGIVGANGGAATSYCVFMGSISADGKCYSLSDFGGIVGYTAKTAATVTNCISVANIERYTISTKPSEMSTDGGTGGIVGYAKGSISYCFSAGYIAGSDLTGGIAGNTNTDATCSYNYSVASLNADLGTTCLRVGGLYGNQTSALTISSNYFAGSTLKSYISSVVDTSSLTTMSNSYYDACISPQSVNNSAKITSDTYARNTALLLSVFSDDTTNSWTTTTTNYPQLKWAAVSIDSDTNATSDFKSLVKALSSITTAVYVAVNDTNAVKNDNTNIYKQLNAYQFNDVQSTSGYLNEPTFTVTNGSATASSWTANETYQNYSANPIGYTWEKDITLTIDGTEYNDIRILRKTLEAANKTEGDAMKITSATFFRFLDVFTTASGAYTGGVYTVTEDIDASSTQITNMVYDDNYFCSELVGNSHTISKVTFANNAYAVFGNINKLGYAHDLKINNVTIGTAASPFTTTNPRVGLFFGSLYGAAVTNLDASNVTMYIDDLSSKPEIGLIAATLSTASDTVTGCDVENAYFQIGAYDGTYASRALSRIGNTGATFGSITKTNVGFCNVSNINMYFNIYEGASSSSGIGGLIGRASNSGYAIYNCTATGNIEFKNALVSNFTSYCGGLVGVLNQYTCSNLSFVGNIVNGGYVGGITAFADNIAGTIENCYVIGNLSSQNIQGKHYAGGIAGQSDNATTIYSGCYFLGNITAPSAGGIIGYTSKATLTNCYANSIVYANGTTSATYAGGLVGQKYGTSTLTLNNSYFTGQVQGGGNSGGLVGLDSATNTVTITNSYYDKSVAGHNLFAVGNITTEFTDCDIETNDITAALLGSGFVQPDAATNYPQISAFQSSLDSTILNHSDYSTRLVFDNDESSYLLGQPSFFLNEVTGEVSVTKNEIQIGTDPITLNIWSDVLDLTESKYSLSASGNTLFTSNFEGILNYKTVTFTTGSAPTQNSTILSFPYQIICKPFDYGTGTQTDPYIIYDLDQFIKFKNFLDAGFDKSGFYYKLGSVSFDEYGTGTIVGAPITIDLSMQDGNAATTDEWEPILNFAGNLDGNNSMISNLKCLTGKTITNTDNSTVSYYGLFGTCAASAVCKDLTISNTGSSAAIYCTNSTSRIGALVADSSGGTFSGIKIQDVSMTTTSSYCNIGGLIGYASGSGLTALSINNCSVVFTAKSNGTYSSNYAGGIIGYMTGIAATVGNCSTYGTITGFYSSGGIVASGISSGSAAITNCGSTVDIATTVSSAYVGGIIGLVTLPVNDSSCLHLTNVFYGGRLASSSATSNVGSLVGMYYKTDTLNTSDTPFPTQEDASIYTNQYVTTPFNSVGDVYTYLVANNSQIFTNCYFPYDLNKYDCANVRLILTYYYNVVEDNRARNSTFDFYSNQNNMEFSTGKSTVLAMTGSGGLTDFSSSTWTFTEGLYPRLSSLVTMTDIASTQIDDSKFSDEILFNSLAIHYTNAGAYGDNTFSNIFIRYSNAAFNSVTSTYLIRTNNHLMIQSTGIGTTTTETLSWTSTSDDAGTYTKTISFIPSTESCGIADYSFFFANTDGMWVSQSTADDVTIKYPWTIYTVDQLNGLAALTGGETDSNGLSVSNPNYSPTVSDGVLGETFVLGVDINADYYQSFRPIGTTDIPFSYSFNGLGYTISNLHLNSATGYQNIGLFGAVQNGEILNVGIISGETSVSLTTLTAGNIVARLLGNATVNGCFSAIPITGTGNTTYVGGLVGLTSGTNNVIRASFNTGYVFLTGSNTYGGGLVGLADGLSIKNCYTAGYLEASNYAALYGYGTATVTNCYYDVNACGEIENTNTAVNRIPTAGDLDSTAFKSFGDGIYYPLQTIFFRGLETLNIYTSAAVVPVTLGNARSVTSGSINSSISGATMNYISSSFVGTVADSSGNVYDSATAFTSFIKANTGLALLKVNNNSAARYFIVNLQCWYDKGELTGVYTINTAKELAEFAAIVNGTLTAENNANGLHTHTVPDSFLGKTVKLGSNIDLSQLSGFSWVPIGIVANPFKGTFDGDGHIISNINISSADSGGNASFFGVIDGATIGNVGLNSGTINCTATFAAGIVAEALNSSSITGCFSSITISGATSCGGIVGQASSDTTVSNSYNMGQISATANVGGIAAINNGVIEYSYNVGIISSAASVSAGISAVNNGTVSNCYNAAFVNGTTIYPISNGTINNCEYDPKMLGETSEVSGVANRIDFATDDNWETYSETKYPELNFFKNNTSNVMQDASELSVLKLASGSGTYNKFTSANVGASIVTDSVSGDVNLTQNETAKVFSIVLNGDSWLVEPIDAGASKLIASTSNSGVAFEHQYYVIAIITMKIRYKFDFSQLFGGNLVLNSNYHDGLFSTTNTWDSSLSVINISTTADFNSFVSYVNSGGTTIGKKFVLNYNINMNSQSISTIGSEAYPFKGTFDGNGYTISNLTVNSSGVTALFGYLDTDSKVENLTLNKFSVISGKTNDDMYVACVAAVNKGNIVNVGIIDGSLIANNSNFSYQTYLGTIVAYNMGKIKGCYFIQSQSITFGIQHFSKVTDYAGGLVGMNSGTVTGCYLVSNMYNANINGLVGNNGGRTDSILNCYFNVNAGDTAPINMEYAYDDVPFNSYFVTATMMKTSEFAEFLSSNLYAGTYESGTAEQFIGGTGGTLINNGYPYLACNQIIKYDIASYFGNNTSMVFSVWNLEEVENTVTASSNFTNGVFAVDNLDYKYFSNIITHNKLQFNMILLPYYMNATISSRVYGANSSFNSDISSSTYAINSGNTNVKDITSFSTSASGAYTVNETAYNDIVKPNLIVVKISFSNNSSVAVPWGVYRTWSSSDD